jgi:ABC-type thiamine transport system ATPase subunit
MAIQMTERETAQLSSLAPPDRANGGLTVDVRTGTIAADGDSFALDVGFAAPAGVTVLFGASGAGKTTVLDCIAGLRHPQSGRIAAGETVLFDAASRTDVPVPNRHVGYVFQTLALFPHMTADDNIQYGIANHPPSERRVRVDEIADSFGIRHVLKRRPRQISGGERQRVALARTLVTDPKVLLLDEPMAVERQAPHSNPLCNARPRGGFCDGRTRGCAGAGKGDRRGKSVRCSGDSTSRVSSAVVRI